MPAGFMFWGLFLALAAILAGYIAWLVAMERRGGLERGPGRATRKDDDAGAGDAQDDVA